MRIAAFLPDSVAATRLRNALPRGRTVRRAEVSFFADWEQLVEAVAGGRFGLCVVHPEGSPGTGREAPSRHLDLLRMAGPHRSRGIVLYLGPEGADPDLAGQWRALGFSHLILKDQDDRPSSLLRALACTLMSCWLCGDGCSPGHGLTREAHLLLLEAVAGYPRPSTVAEMAKRRGLSESALRRLHREAGIPCPRDCLRLANALEVAALGELGVGTANHAATLLGFSASSSLSRHLRELDALTTATLLRQGGMDKALSALSGGTLRRSA